MNKLIAAVALAASLLAVGCTRPEPPVLTPEQGKLTSLSTSGIGLTARLDAYNPNGVDLSARSVSARIVLDGNVDLGVVRVASGVKLPAKKHTVVEVPLSVAWTDVAAFGRLALQNRPIPYVIDGTAELGGESFSVNVPFKITGSITHEQLAAAAVSSLPKIPGLPSIPGLTFP